MIVLRDQIVAEMQEGQENTWNVRVDNFGGLACIFSVEYEACAGGPIPWFTLSADSGGIWPGGSDPLIGTINTTGLDDGIYCGRAIFNSTSFAGPDTLDLWLTVTPDPVDAPPDGIRPGEFALSAPRPNPTRGEAEITLALPAEAAARVTVYSVDGRRVATLRDGRLPAGWHRLAWNLRDDGGARVAPGAYFVRAVSGGRRAVEKLIVLD
jgi:hypothetical protein